MATLADAIAAFDTARAPIVAALKATGASYLNSDGGAIWLLTYDTTQFAGFRATPVQKASSVPIPDAATPPAGTTA